MIPDIWRIGIAFNDELDSKELVIVELPMNMKNRQKSILVIL